MAAKDIIFDQRAREAILRGLDTLADVVKVTLGPTTATVLAQAIFREGAKLVAAGYDPMGMSDMGDMGM
jgi:chaperonin GroEL (HSP60 family)